MKYFYCLSMHRLKKGLLPAQIYDDSISAWSLTSHQCGEVCVLNAAREVLPGNIPPGNIHLTLNQLAHPCLVTCRGDAVRSPPKKAGGRTASPRYMTGEGCRVKSNCEALTSSNQPKAITYDSISHAPVSHIRSISPLQLSLFIDNIPPSHSLTHPWSKLYQPRLRARNVTFHTSARFALIE